MANALDERVAKKHALKMRDDVRDKSLSQRMSEGRVGENQPVNPWAQRSVQLEAEKAARTAEQQQTPKARAKAANLRAKQDFDAETRRMKAASDASRLENQKAKEPVAPQAPLGVEDVKALLAAFIDRAHAAGHHMSEFNVLNLWNRVHHAVASGQPGWSYNSECFELAMTWLQKNGFWEQARNTRGMTPGAVVEVKSYPHYEAPKQQLPQPTQRDSVYIRRDEQEISEARKLSFEELQRQARSSFKVGGKS